MQTYHHAASTAYSDNPEGQSIMVLTIFALWVACDKSATRIHPLLHQYSPDINMNLLQSLLLPARTQMQWLFELEEYNAKRISESTFNATKALCEFATGDCFPVRYFSSSSDHHRLLALIQSDATTTRDQKREEFRSKKDRYNELIRLYNQISCTFIDVTDKYDGTITQEDDPGY